MTRKTYGLIAGLIAAGVGTWWWRSRPGGAPAAEVDTHGTVIFNNTPQPSTPDGNLNL